MRIGHKRVRLAFGLCISLAWCSGALALNPSLDISQYAHKAWTARDGFSVGTIFAMAQTPDGYLWLGSEFGLYRFDGVRTMQWQRSAGQSLPAAPYSLLVTRDGTLWIGTFAGLLTLREGKLIPRPLQNLIERSVIMSRGPVLRVPVAHLHSDTVANPGAAHPRTLEEAEREHILSALKETKWVLSGPYGAAARLGLNRSTLQFRMKKLGIVRPCLQ